MSDVILETPGTKKTKRVVVLDMERAGEVVISAIVKGRVEIGFRNHWLIICRT